jgi:hypothetical protein
MRKVTSQHSSGREQERPIFQPSRRTESAEKVTSQQEGGKEGRVRGRREEEEGIDRYILLLLLLLLLPY